MTDVTTGPQAPVILQQGSAQRQDHPIEIRGRLGPADRAFAGGCPLIGEACTALEPALITRYTRATLLVGAGRSRVTIDTDVEGRTPDGRTVTLVGMVIVESKSPGPPSEADRVLWSLGYRPTRVSKYCTSLAMLRPDLPSNRWTQALRQPWHVADAGEPPVDESEDWPVALAG